MFVKVKNWFENLFREYILVFSKINENKTSIKEGVSTLLIKYNEFCNELKNENPNNDFFKPILNEKLKSSISEGKKLAIAYIRKELLAKAQYFCIELYELGIEVYIAKNIKNKIVFNPDDFTKNDIQKQKQNILKIIAKEDKEFAEKKHKIELKKLAKEAKKNEKNLNNTNLKDIDIKFDFENDENPNIVDEQKNVLNNVFNTYTSDDQEILTIDSNIDTLSNDLIETFEEQTSNNTDYDEIDVNVEEIIDDVPSFDLIETNLNDEEDNSEQKQDEVEIELNPEKSDDLELEILDEEDLLLLNNNLEPKTEINEVNTEISETIENEFDPMVSMRENDILDEELVEVNEDQANETIEEIAEEAFDFDNSEIPSISNKYENAN